MDNPYVEVEEDLLNHQIERTRIENSNEEDHDPHFGEDDIFEHLRTNHLGRECPGVSEEDALAIHREIHCGRLH